MLRFAGRQILASAALAMMISVAAFAQVARSSPSSDGLELLTRVAKKYADAKSYYIESVEERTSSTEYSHDWQKTTLTAAESLGNRYYYEGRSNMGSTVRVTDGKTVWTYRVNENRYVAKPLSVAESNRPKRIAGTEMALMQAENLRKRLSKLTNSLRSADRLPDATLKVNGRKFSCNVVRVRSSNQKRVPVRTSFDKIIWIDKNRQILLKEVEHSHTYMMIPGGADIPIEEETTTTYASTILNKAVRDVLFTFVPPPGAKLIEDFPDPTKHFFGSSMTGEPAPALELKTTEGKMVSLDSFRGRPVLIDIWATWCAPCMAALPKLAKIYEEAKDKGLILISVDQDEEAKTAADLLSKRGYTWPDFHDDGEIEKLMGPSPIPRVVLIDGRGKIVYDNDLNEDDLRTEIAKLGPEYASLRPKPSQVPCTASD